MKKINAKIINMHQFDFLKPKDCLKNMKKQKMLKLSIEKRLRLQSTMNN